MRPRRSTGRDLVFNKAGLASLIRNRVPYHVSVSPPSLNGSQSFSFGILSCRPASTLEKLIAVLTHGSTRGRTGQSTSLTGSPWFIRFRGPGETPVYVHPSFDETRDSCRHMGIWEMHPGSQSAWHKYVYICTEYIVSINYYGSGAQRILHVVCCTNCRK